ncbi:hypothetical protein J3454_05705 [Erythrobacter sp. NFXS35]|uniref:beta strand repeat-containing protein n=1 Tax=Erythrobacter sp. NFXS35 TaxID=2818436 RepID=UPI0032DF4425
MTDPIRNRSRLLVGCGSSALALALALGLPQRAEAQAINATGDVTVGSASINDLDPGQTTISVFSETAVINWTPDEVNGDALDFLPTGTTAIFEAGEGQLNFAVLNRILPSTNGNIVVIDGTVLSRIFDVSGNAVPGGFIAFYSPTGILIGSNATFDVGSLLLTTLDTADASFQNFFENNGTLQLAGATGSTARIQIDAGAQIAASPENAFFAVVAADVAMSGTALVNGSHAYVAGEVVNLRVSNGLFDIEIPVGTAATGMVMNINGTVGGESSGGAGDNHMIYGVAAAQNDPISMLFSGNLGFDEALDAGIVNGEIILSANYDVFGRNVQGDTISNGINAVFGQGPDPFAPPRGEANILMQDFASTSSILAIGTDTVGATAVNSASSVDGNLLIVGRRNAELTAANGQAFDITGDVLVSSRAFGVVDMGLQDPALINAQGGTALIDVSDGGTMTIGGNALVTAEAIGGALDFDTAGTATGGTALVGSTGGSLSILGNVEVNANARVTGQVSSLTNGATVTGGLAEVFAAQGGAVTLGGNVGIFASAFGSDALTSSDAFGGAARMSIIGEGTIGIDGSVDIFADAFGGNSAQSEQGSLGDAGDAGIEIDGAGTITIEGGVLIGASGFGGTNFGDGSGQGTGGTGLGGTARVFVAGDGSLIIGSDFSASANAVGGGGPDGGDAFGGIAGANVLTGLIDIGGTVFANADAIGGDADDGFGGNGGNAFGGNAYLQADGGLNSPGTINAAGALISATGSGGRGGDGDSSDFPAGDGGNGTGGSIATPNQADPMFNGGAFLLAGGDNGFLNITGDAFVDASGTGGRGGNGAPSQFSIRRGGNGGIGTGGRAEAGLALLGGSGAIGNGVASFGSLFVEANAFGGSGGFGGQTGDPRGFGGDAFGGDAVLTVSAGEVIADFAFIGANAFGGNGQAGADGEGGNAGIQGALNGALALGSLDVSAQGFGGFAESGPGGIGRGGEAFIALDGITATFTDDVFINADGFGGFSQSGDGGDGTGGTAYIGVTEGTLGSGTFDGNASIVANGFGGDGGAGAAGGTGTGGLAFVEAQAGSTIRFGTLQVTASGAVRLSEGQPAPQAGRDGIGGTAELRSSGSGSQIIVERNFGDDFEDSLNGGGIVAALGLGGDANGGSGEGGRGVGGSILLRAALGGSITLPQDPVNDPNSNGANRLLAYGIGGGSNVEGGRGGEGSAGSGEIDIEGGTIIMGRTNFSVYGQGGSSLDTTRNIDGGGGFGGSRTIRVFDGGSLTGEIAEGQAGGFGGNGSGSGNGGFATTGRSEIEVIGGTMNIVGNLLWVDSSTGGSGNIGGDVFGGEGLQSAFDATDATIDFSANGAGESGLILGANLRGGEGITEGGDVNGGFVRFALTNSDLSGGNILVSTLAAGGGADGQGGRGGNAQASSVSVNFMNSTVELLGSNEFSAVAVGGNNTLSGSGGQGGNADSGTVRVSLSTSQVTVVAVNSGPGILRLRSQASGGQGDQLGMGLSGTAELQLVGGTLTADEVRVEAQGLATAISPICNISDPFCDTPSGGGGNGGLAAITLQGDAVLNAGLIELVSDAETSAGGTAQAGTSSLIIAAGSSAQVFADEIILTADAFGGNSGEAANTAGRFVVEIGGGSLNTANLSASARGDTLSSSAPPSLLVAEGGDINVTGNLDAFALGDIQVRTAQGNIIGSATDSATTTTIDLFARGMISILGDDDAAIGLGGDEITLTAREIDIEDGARIGARSVLFNSLDLNHTAIIGGDVDEIGFTLTAAEIGRINADNFAFVGSSVITEDPNQPDVLVRDFTISGSLNDGFSRFSIFPVAEGPGIVRVEGTVSYLNAASEDEFVIGAGERIEVVTPGGIRITDTDGLPGGILTLSADDLWVADADTIAQLQSDRAFAGRDELLAVAVEGSDDPLGYLRAGEVSIFVGESLLVRNTGGSTGQGGILVGGGGLSIAASSSQGEPLDVFAYGRRQRDDGSFVTGNDFFSEVNFNRTGQGLTAYLELSAFNDCIINTGECPLPPPPPTEPETPRPSNPDLPPLNNPTVILDPVTWGEPTGESVAEQNDKFGMDFPERPEAPLISEEPLLDDPVTSGSDAALYSPPGNASAEEK